ncbi:Rpp14/Pop5 family-domain-containing protein [Massariosphaeria phaeospora]|uniref:Ribonuclease P/MRP protein subunit POP5 n=1 Tax=Massariosphaeria phaeospora TaxID=100035 RepID=A0A7C8I6C7_9PLEO|nr:Rpp14/Pop5 family-domain-containing protein [Massariosphaeria phaeospora]
MVRIKNRYLVVNFLYPAPPSSTDSKDPVPGLLQFHAPTPDAFHVGLLARVIRDGVLELYGDYGLGMINSSLKVNYWSLATSTAIIRCSRDHYQMVWAALTFITKLPGTVGSIPVVARVVRVSGTIRSAEMEVIRRAQDIIRRAKNVEGGGEDLKMVEEIVKAVDRREEQVLVQVDEQDEEDESASESE